MMFMFMIQKGGHLASGQLCEVSDWKVHKPKLNLEGSCRCCNLFMCMEGSSWKSPCLSSETQ